MGFSWSVAVVPEGDHRLADLRYVYTSILSLPMEALWVERSLRLLEESFSEVSWTGDGRLAVRVVLWKAAAVLESVRKRVEGLQIARHENWHFTYECQEFLHSVRTAEEAVHRLRSDPTYAPAAVLREHGLDSAAPTPIDSSPP